MGSVVTEFIFKVISPKILIEKGKRDWDMRNNSKNEVSDNINPVTDILDAICCIISIIVFMFLSSVNPYS